MKTINDFAYKSKLVNIHPLYKIVFASLLLIVCISFNDYSVGLFTFFYMSFISLVYSKISLYRYIKILMIPCGFLVVGVIPILLDINMYSNSAFQINVFGVYVGTNLENIKLAATVACKSLGAVACMYFISLSTTMNDIFAGLRKLRLPGMVITLIELIYRYVYVLQSQSVKIKISQISRCGYKSFGNSVYCSAKLIANLFLKTYDKCDRAYNAMLSRGYENGLKFLEKKYEKTNVFYWYFAFYITVIIGICFYR